MSADFFDDESGQIPGRERRPGFFHAFLQEFQHHHIADDDAVGMGRIDAGGFRSLKDAFTHLLRCLFQIRVLVAFFGEFNEKPFYPVFLWFVHDNGDMLLRRVINGSIADDEG